MVKIVVLVTWYLEQCGLIVSASGFGRLILKCQTSHGLPKSLSPLSCLPLQLVWFGMRSCVSFVHCFTIPSSISLPYRIDNSFFRFMGAAALQKYIGSLGGIGASGVGSSSSYTPKELNKEVTPDKVSFQCFVPQIYYLVF